MHSSYSDSVAKWFDASTVNRQLLFGAGFHKFQVVKIEAKISQG